jgi:hypothetical protein
MGHENWSSEKVLRPHSGDHLQKHTVYPLRTKANGTLHILLQLCMRRLTTQSSPVLVVCLQTTNFRQSSCPCVYQRIKRKRSEAINHFVKELIIRTESRYSFFTNENWRTNYSVCVLKETKSPFSVHAERSFSRSLKTAFRSSSPGPSFTPPLRFRDGGALIKNKCRC